MIAALALSFVCVVGQIHDGDTWRCVGGPRVRLWGVDAAELNRPGGPEARAALIRLIAGRRLVCEARGRSYDRIVALCTVGGRDIAAEMVGADQAMDWPRYSGGYYARARP